VIGTLFAAGLCAQQDERAADIQAIEALKRATWDRPDAPLASLGWDRAHRAPAQFRAADRRLQTGLSLFTLR
jgi:hypothetical protein